MKKTLIFLLIICISEIKIYSQKIDRITFLKSKNHEFQKNDLETYCSIFNKKNTLKKEKENSNPNYRKIADDYEYVWTSFNIKNLNSVINTSLKSNIDNNLREKIRNHNYPIVVLLFLDKNGNIKELEITLDKENNFTGDDFDKIEEIIKKIKVPVVDKRNTYYKTINYVVINAFIIPKEF
jgi:hypothetical protein